MTTIKVASCLYIKSKYCCKHSPALQLHLLELVVQVKFSLRAQWLACQHRELAGESHQELLCHTCLVNAGLVEIM